MLLARRLPRPRLLTAGVVLGALAGVASAGCGGSASPGGANDLMLALERPQKCLAEVGASRAERLADIEFFADDFEKGQTDKPAAAGNGTIEVREYRPVGKGDLSGQPSPEYVVWVGQSADEQELDPLALIGEAQSEGVVMFVRNPDWSQIRGAMTCLDNLGAATLG
jgi:hypothetical protein